MLNQIESDLVLPSGDTLSNMLALLTAPAHVEFAQKGILFLDDKSVGAVFGQENIMFLNDLFPKLPETPPYFQHALDACRALIDDPSIWPSRPSTTNSVERQIWHYVCTAVLHLYVSDIHLPALNNLTIIKCKSLFSTRVALPATW